MGGMQIGMANAGRDQPDQHFTARGGHGPLLDGQRGTKFAYNRRAHGGGSKSSDISLKG
jgi:hypothetical protein